MLLKWIENSPEENVKQMLPKMLKMMPNQDPGNALERRLKIGWGPFLGVPSPILALRGVQVVSWVFLWLFGCVFCVVPLLLRVFGYVFWCCSRGHFEGNRIYFRHTFGLIVGLFGSSRGECLLWNAFGVIWKLFLVCLGGHFAGDRIHVWPNFRLIVRLLRIIMESSQGYQSKPPASSSWTLLGNKSSPPLN